MFRCWSLAYRPTLGCMWKRNFRSCCLFRYCFVFPRVFHWSFHFDIWRNSYSWYNSSRTTATVWIFIERLDVLSFCDTRVCWCITMQWRFNDTMLHSAVGSCISMYSNVVKIKLYDFSLNLLLYFIFRYFLDFVHFFVSRCCLIFCRRVCAKFLWR